MDPLGYRLLVSHKGLDQEVGQLSGDAGHCHILRSTTSIHQQLVQCMVSSATTALPSSLPTRSEETTESERGERKNKPVTAPTKGQWREGHRGKRGERCGVTDTQQRTRFGFEIAATSLSLHIRSSIQVCTWSSAIQHMAEGTGSTPQVVALKPRRSPNTALGSQQTSCSR